LRAALQAACGGHGGLLLVSGEAGIGKTSLVRDVSQFAEVLGMRVVSGSSYDLSTTPHTDPGSKLCRI
jgi:predicted ATPase